VCGPFFIYARDGVSSSHGPIPSSPSLFFYYDFDLSNLNLNEDVVISLSEFFHSFKRKFSQIPSKVGDKK
jgi:hypothetical protein